MTAKFKVGDHVIWNSEAGHVSGRIIEAHRKDFYYKGRPTMQVRRSRNTQRKMARR